MKNPLVSGQTTSIVTSTPSTVHPTIARQTKREVDTVIGQIQVAEMIEEGRGLLTSLALHHAGSVSALESHLTQIAPNGAHRYQAIADAHAIGAAQLIARWSQWIW